MTRTNAVPIIFIADCDDDQVSISKSTCIAIIRWSELYRSRLYMFTILQQYFKSSNQSEDFFKQGGPII